MNQDNVIGSCSVAVDILTSSTELNQLTGIAALLTFPLDIEVVEAEEREAEEERKRQLEVSENSES